MSLRFSLVAVVFAALCAVATGAVGPPDVLVRTLPSATETWVGRPVVFNVVVSNLGGSDAEEVTLSIAVGGTATGKILAVDAEAADCSTPDPAHVTCTMSRVARNATARARLQLQPTLPGTLEVSAHVAAPGETDPSNDDASASTLVHPGRQGPPALRATGRVAGAYPDAADLRIARVQGRFDLSEPGRVTVKVLDRRTGLALPVLAGSSIGGTKLTARRTSVVVPVGGPQTASATSVLFDVRLPIARLRAGRSYELLLAAVDLEGAASDPLAIRFTFHAAG